MLVSLTEVFVFLSFTWNDTLQSKGEKLERWLHNRLKRLHNRLKRLKRQKSLRISLRPIWDLICLVYGEIDFSSLFSDFLSPKYAKSNILNKTMGYYCLFLTHSQCGARMV